MLKDYWKPRANHLIAVYVEPSRIELIRGQRRWRSWQFLPPEVYPIGVNENPFALLQHLNLRPQRGKRTLMLAIISRVYHSFHREYYPSTLKDQISQVLSFDWEENLLLGSERSYYFADCPTSKGDLLFVPIFSMHKDTYEKFFHALNGTSFHYFNIVPSALALKTLVGSSYRDSYFAARCIDPHRIEIHRYQGDCIIDSLLLSRDSRSMELFLEELRSYEKEFTIPVFCEQGEDPEILKALDQRCFVKRYVNETLISRWVQGFVRGPDFSGLGENPIALKPKPIPKIVYLVAGILFFYASFVGYQVHARSRLLNQLRELKIYHSQLAKRWQPIEQLREKIIKLREKQKSFEEFDAKGYPVLQLLTLLTDITPMDTWIEFFDLQGKELRLRGQSNAAVKYVALLSQVEGFTNVRLVSPIRRDPRFETERFYVRIELNPKKLKERLKKIDLPCNLPATLLPKSLDK